MEPFDILYMSFLDIDGGNDRGEVIKLYDVEEIFAHENTNKPNEMIKKSIFANLLLTINQFPISSVQGTTLISKGDFVSSYFGVIVTLNTAFS